MQYNAFTKNSLTKASHIALEYSGKVSGKTKGDDSNQVLTDADIAIGKYLILQVRTHFPEHNIIDEEAGVIDNGSTYTWVIDPIDGTSNFAAGLPYYCIMLGLLKDHIPVVGGLIVPVSRDLYFAEKGKGAFCNDKKLHVTQENNLLSTLVGFGIDGHRENPDSTRDECSTLAEIILEIRNLRDTGNMLDAMQVAEGKFGGYVNWTSKVWDNVAPQIICEEAGAVYTDFFGKQIDYSHSVSQPEKNFTICTAPPVLHKQLQSIIHKT